MNFHNVKNLSLASIVSLFLVATSVLGFSSVIPKVAASPIDDLTAGGGDSSSSSSSNSTDTTMSNNTSLNTTTSSTPITPRVELGEEPFAIGRYSPVSENVINETQELQIFFEGSTTITLPNSTETITTRDTGEGIITLLPGGGVISGHVQMTTEDGSESASMTLTEYYLDLSPTAINLAYFSTNSTGILEPLNNMIAVSLDEEQPNGDVMARFFEWEVDTSGSGNDTTAMTATTTTETPVIPTP
jgi:hypothetical protein